MPKRTSLLKKNNRGDWKISSQLVIRALYGFMFLILSAGFLPIDRGFAQDTPGVILYQENFDSGAAPGWELEPGWQLAADDLGGWALSGEGHSWARPQTESWTDFHLQFRLKLLGGRVHLVYRLNNIGRYFIGFEEAGSDLHKQYWPDTFIDGLARKDSVHGLGGWRQIEIVGEGPSLRLLVDGELEWEYLDPEPLLNGTFAFETLDNSAVLIDDIVVTGQAPTMPPEAPPSSAGEFNWVRTGGPLGGLGYDVRMRPGNPENMYVTDAFAGVFISQDGGAMWFPSNAGISTRTGTSGDSIPIFCLTIDPHNPDIVWAGTQNVRGLYKSIDAGSAWVKMDNGVKETNGITFRGITVDPRSSRIVYAAAELASWVWNGEPRDGREFDMTGGVVYKSADGGQNWYEIWRGDNLARYIWIDPNNPQVLYLSTGIFDREAANSDPGMGVPGGEGVLKSTDGGTTWAHANNGLENLYVGTLFMNAEDPNILLAGTGNVQYFHGNGVYLTTDGGASWQKTLGDDNINAVEFASSDPQIAYAGSAGAIYRSEDTGRTWRRVSGGEDGWGPPGVRAGFPIDFQVDPLDPNRVFANEYGGGNFLSTDGGQTWTVASSGYTGAQVRDITVDPATGKVYAAARSGAFLSQDGGDTWLGLNTPPAYAMEWYVVEVDPVDPQHLLAANNWNGVLLASNNGGQRWRPVSDHAGEMKSWRAIYFSPSNPQVVYAGTSAFYSAGTFDDRMPAAGVFRSQDGGESWAPANDALSQDANVTALGVAADNPQLVYAATGNHGALRSLDGGDSWEKINAGLPGEPAALSIAVHPVDEYLVFVGLAGGGLYRSVDGGNSWGSSMAGLNPEAAISDVRFDPVDATIMYTADLFSGVYRSTDGGGSWASINDGLRTRAVNKLALSADGAHLYAATDGEGVYRLDLHGEPPQPVLVSEPTTPPLVETQEPLPSSPADTPAAPASTGVPIATETPASGVGKFCGSAFILPLTLVLGFWLRKGLAG